jgi:sulfhydrogenase subunit beta (sulfur reductase)
MNAASGDQYFRRDQLQLLLDALQARNFRVIGPTIDQGAIVYAEVQSVDDLPHGWTDVQEPGRYRLERRPDDAYFGYVVGPHSWKKYLFPPHATVAIADQGETGWQMRSPDEHPLKLAFLGVRACELAAIRVQDRVFLEGPFVDPIYKARRDQAFIIAVNCTQAGATCFCTSMQTGPECRDGYDLALTEIPDGFVVAVGSERGRELLDDVSPRAAEEPEQQAAGMARADAVAQVTKHMDTAEIRDLLLSNLNHPRWANVAERCLSCTNCTMVCPTCFCTSVTEVSDLAGTHVERQRHWDSCFNLDFSYMNGGNVRNDVRSRYRQWLTHKLASWIDQFGTSGCVGCGRCITWCPVGIDLTEEVAAIRGFVSS